MATEEKEYRYKLTQGELLAFFFGKSEDEVRKKFRERFAKYDASQPISVQRLPD
jgi:hypothetical protein